MTSNGYKVKELGISKILKFFMGRLDASSLFTNIPFEVTIDICIQTLFENTKIVGFSKLEFKELLSLVTKVVHFNFNGKI